MSRSGAEGPWVGHAKGTAGYRRVLLALFFAGIATFAQLYSVQGVLPGLARDFDVSPADAALTVSTATLGLALAVIPWSWVADRVGRKRTMTWAISAAVGLGFLVSAAPTFEALLLIRFAEGVALGGIPAVALVYLHEEIQKLYAAVAAGTYVAGTTIGGLTGRIVAAPVAEMSDWRMGVLVVSGLAGLSAAAFLWLAPPPRGFEAHVPGVGPPLWKRVVVNLRSGRLLALYAQGFLLMGGFVAVYNYLGFRLERAPFLLPESLASLMFLAYLAGTATSRIAGTMTVRYGRLPVLLAGIPVMIGGLAVTLADSIPWILVGLLIFTGGFFIVHSIAAGWTPGLASLGRGQASSLYNFSYYAGSSLLGWTGGLFFVRFGWPGVAGFAAGLAVLAGIIAAGALRSAPGARPALR